MFDRNRDPNNLEELMVSEFMANKETIAEQKKQIEELQITMVADHDELMELLEAEEAKVAQLQSVLAKDQGVVDLQSPILMYKSEVASNYYYKDWLEDHADDEGEDEGLDGYINALGLNDADCIKWFAEHSKSYRHMVKTSKHVFKFTLQVPVFGVMAYDPEYNKCQLYAVEKKYADEHWVDMPLEEFREATAKKVRAVANKALKEYKDALAEKAKEQTES